MTPLGNCPPLYHLFYWVLTFPRLCPLSSPLTCHSLYVFSLTVPSAVTSAEKISKSVSPSRSFDPCLSGCHESTSDSALSILLQDSSAVPTECAFSILGMALAPCSVVRKTQTHLSLPLLLHLSTLCTPVLLLSPLPYPEGRPCHGHCPISHPVSAPAFSPHLSRSPGYNIQSSFSKIEV